MAKYWVRKPYHFIDALGTEDEDMRRGFMEDAPTLGKVQAGGNTASAHVLFANPLIIGTALSRLGSERSVVFHPLSPGVQSEFTTCSLVESNEQVDYAILRCKDMEGSGMRLKPAFPKLTARPAAHFLSFNTAHQEKIVGAGNHAASDVGGYITDKLGTNHMTAVLTTAGPVPVGDPRLHDLFDKHIWPLCRLYSRKMEQHYFTYFRQYEKDNDLVPSGSGNRIDFKQYEGMKEMRIRSAISSAYKYVRSFFSETREPSI